MSKPLKSLLEPAYLKLFGRKPFYALHRALFLVSLKGMGMNVTAGVPTMGEAGFIRSLARRLPADATVFDVGANVGKYSLDVARAVPAARIFLFEPNPRLHPQLRQNAEKFSGEVIPCAVSSAAGEVELFDRDDQTGGAFGSLSQDVAAFQTDAAIVRHAVRAITIDGFVAERGIERIDFMKIDVEGFELEVLKGAQRTLAEGRIGLIQMEFNYCNFINRVFMADIRAAMRGFDVFRILADGSLVPLDEDPKFSEIFTFQNIVAIRRADGAGAAGARG